MRRTLATLGCIVVLCLVPAAGFAQDSLAVTVTPTATCGEATFSVEVTGGSAPYAFSWAYGDGEIASETSDTLPYTSVHTYPAQGAYAWTLSVLDAGSLAGSATGTLTIEGPTASLTSVPFPPMLTLGSGDMTVQFQAGAVGGSAPYTYEWDLDGDGLPDPTIDPASPTASFVYDQAGKFQASVTVIDSCGFTSTASLPVLVVDPETVCHPMAQRIADAVSALFPTQAEDLYTCEDIYNIFVGGLTGSQLGFGRMWHAYKLTQVIDDLTWEEILDWHLDGNGWGPLLQLNRFANELEDVELADLVERVLAGEISVGDVRTAVRAATRFGANFEDALERSAAGASPGEIGRFYRMGEELQVEPEVLDEYLESGTTLQELKHAADLAGRLGSDWTEVLDAHANGHSWGEISQAYKLASEENLPADLLEMGVKEFRQQQREEARSAEGDDQIARTAARIASQYGVTQEEVLTVYEGQCGADWGCVRAHFRDLSGETRGKDNKGKGNH